MRASTVGFVAVVAGVGLSVAITVRAQQEQPVSPPPPTSSAAAPATAEPPFPTVTVTDEMRAHQHWVDGLYFAGTAYGFLLLLFVLGLGISRWLRELAGRVVRRPFLLAMLFFAFFSITTTILSLPMDWLSDYRVPHHFGLSAQSLGSWLWDQLKGLLLGIAIGAPIVALALAGIRRVRRWWLALWIGAVPITVFLILIGPVVLDPVFNDFRPLKDAQLREEILTLAARAGIEGGRVYEVDKSKQTKEMNAYVNGLGPTKRIVLWDTTIAKMTHDEIGFAMAHEMGHYVLHHIWKLIGVVLVMLFVVFWASQRVVEAAVGRWGRAWGFETAHDPAAVPLLLLVVSVGMFILTPVMNGVTRYFEHEADTFALELTHANHAGGRTFVKLAEDSKVLPDPSAIIRFWRYSHPTLAERIVFCRTYRPWEKGEPNRVWHGAQQPLPAAAPGRG